MTQDQVVEKPVPEPDEASGPFWRGGLEDKLMLMRCTECGAYRIPARRHCDKCLATDFTWEQASGRGVVRTFGIMHQRYHAAWAADLPYNIAVIELEEGPRFPSNLVGISNADIRVGMPVQVTFEKHEDAAIPKFRPANQ